MTQEKKFPSSLPPNTVHLSLSVHYRSVVGQVLFVVGSVPQLGQWSAPKRMQWTENHWWRFSTVLDPTVGNTVDYKYFIGSYNSQNGGIWESSSNRKITFPSTSGVFIEITDTWEDPNSTRKQLDLNSGSESACTTVSEISD